MVHKDIISIVGHTPTIKLKNKLSNISVYAKLEGQNPTGSLKDRAAVYVLRKGLQSGLINRRDGVIESSSGNYAIALAYFAQSLRIPFTCVIDPKILPINENILRVLGANIVKIKKPDAHGGYLLERIAYIRSFLKKHPGTYWINQYANPLNAAAYGAIATEIHQELSKLDYVFVGVGSGGTITGISQKIKKLSPTTRVVAVDVEGSVIFGGKGASRSIPGIGSSMQPVILKKAKIDDVVVVTEEETMRACKELLKEDALFVGGSSGSVYAACKKYFRKRKTGHKNVALIFADRGERYAEKVFLKTHGVKKA